MIAIQFDETGSASSSILENKIIEREETVFVSKSYKIVCPTIIMTLASLLVYSDISSIQFNRI